MVLFIIHITHMLSHANATRLHLLYYLTHLKALRLHVLKTTPNRKDYFVFLRHYEARKF